MRGITVLALLGALAATPTLVEAQDSHAWVRPAGEPRALGEYQGVAPGTGHLPPRARRARGGQARLMTWPGFQQRPDGASRFFVQTTTAVSADLVNEEGRAVILLRNTRVHLRNNRRTLETRYFNTPVTRARVQARGRDVAIVLEMRAGVAPRIQTQQADNGFFFVLIEFPGGDFAEEFPERDPAGPQQNFPARDSAVVGGQAIDDERPPAFGN